VYVNGPVPPDTSALKDMLLPASMPVGATGVPVNDTVGTAFTVYGPTDTELTDTGVFDESCTTTFALIVLPIRLEFVVNVKLFVDPALMVLIIALVMEL